MHKIKRNTRGTAEIIALLVFFLAALSGTIALTMAASNAGRYTHEKEDQQEYLSVISAANIILDRLNGVSIVYEAKVVNQSPQNTDEIDIEYTGTGKQDLFLKDPRFTDNLMQFSLNGSWTPMVFSLEADRGMGKVSVGITASGSILSFRLYHVSGFTRNYQMTLSVATRFLDGGYTQEETDGFFRRHMIFDTESAEYTVEKNVPSGGTDE